MRIGKSTFRKWITLVDGTSLYLTTRKEPREAFRVLKLAGLYLEKKADKTDELSDMNRLLKKMGAKKLSKNEHQRFKAHFGKR